LFEVDEAVPRLIVRLPVTMNPLKELLDYYQVFCQPSYTIIELRLVPVPVALVNRDGMQFIDNRTL
jgi:hypothetical protein